MKTYIKVSLILSLFCFIDCAEKLCNIRHIPNSDTVCVCNVTYCDTIPKISKPKTGFASIYESNKSGIRFKATEIQIKSTPEKSNLPNSQTITINKTQKYQSIDGFGGAFTDSTGYELKSLPESMANTILDDYFSANGMEYTIGKVPMASTDYSLRMYTYDDVEGDLNLTHFAIQKEDLELKIPYIKKAEKLSPHKMKLIACPWHPPMWMRTGPHSPLKEPVGGQYYQTWAHYFIKFLDAYKAQGINFWGITPLNEPEYGQSKDASPVTLNFTVDEESVFIAKNLGPALEKSGYTKDKLKLLIFDDNVHNIEKWANKILPDKNVAKYVSGISYHWYSDHRMSGYPDLLLNNIHNKFPEYFLFMSEASHLEGPGNGRWDYGEHYAYDIIRALNNWVTGWVEWNYVLDTNAGPPYKKGFGGLVFVNSTLKEVYKQPAFYIIGHFSKFIPPNSVRIGHKVDKAIEGLSVLTVKRPDNSTVLVAFNANDHDIAIHINDSNNFVSHTIPARSIQSYIW